MKKKLLWVLKNFEEIVSATAIGVTLLLTTTNVLLRFFLNTSIPGYSDISVFCFAWAVFLGMSACYKQGLHYGVDFLMVVLPFKGKKVLRIIIDILVLITCIVGLWLNFRLFYMTQTTTGRVSSYLGLSYGYMYLSGVLGFAFMVFYSIRNLVQDVKKLFGKQEEEETV